MIQYSTRSSLQVRTCVPGGRAASCQLRQYYIICTLQPASRKIVSKLRKPAKVVNNVLDSPQTKRSRGKGPSHLGRTNGRARGGSFAGGRALPRDAGTGARSSRWRQGSQTLKYSNTQTLKRSITQTAHHPNTVYSGGGKGKGASVPLGLETP